MRYFKTFRDSGERIEINRDEAKTYLESSYVNVDKLLDTPSVYPLMFSVIEIVKE